MEIFSSAFKEGEEIPKQYTCQGRNVSPPLNWTGVPEKAKSLVLIIDDPDAPDPAAPKMTWDHWIVYNVSPEITEFEENITESSIPKGAALGTTSWENTSYGGPCPPIGKHRYYHKLYALDITLTALDKPTKKELLHVMEAHVIAKASLMGTYQKK